jgi:putative nucleotidyltransferase with HDIG domain
MKTTNRRADPEAGLLYEETGDHLLRDGAPSAWLREAWRKPGFGAYPFSLLKKLEQTPQSPVHHPEGSVWNHTLLVVDEAARHRAESGDPASFMWAALLHDIGKPATTRIRKGRITAYDHDKVGAELAREFLYSLTEDRRFVEKVAHLVKYHMQALYVVNNLPFQDIDGMKRNSDIGEVALLCLCDRLGRSGASKRDEEAQVSLFVDRCYDE